MEMSEQEFLQQLERKLWTAADKLRSNLDAAVYKHAVLGLIFLKYVSDAFDERRREIEAMLRDPEHDYGVLRENYASDQEYEDIIADELEIRDYYIEKNVFWVPEIARWKTLQDNAKMPIGSKITFPRNGVDQTIDVRSTGHLIDTALDFIEKENPKLKGVLNKTYTQLQIEHAILGQLIDLIATIPFHHETLRAKDILGHVYEYFLGQFALAEGKKGGQYFTPKSIVGLIVEMLQPFQGWVYDPAMGSGGFFVQSEKFIEEHGGKLGQISVYGQESNPTTWRLAAMNMAIRGIDFNFGKEPANSFSNDKHPDLRADFVMANPPFNMKEWNTGVKDDDSRWQYGIPPAGNANFAWMQHMLYHLAPNGTMGLLLANGSMSSNTNNEGEIRKKLLEEDRVECMVALPGQLFTNTQIPACIWFLTKNKKARNGYRDRSGQVLFIDARNLGYMKDRVLRDFKPEDIRKIADTFHQWRTAPPLPRGEGEGEGKRLPEKLLKNARELRKKQTDAESLLWELLRDRQLANFKFRRQHPVEPYILDFYCHEKQLAVELDGGHHNTEQEQAKDQKRTDYLESKGINVIRFWNNDVLVDTDAVLEEIYNTLALTQTLSQRERAYKDIPGFCKSASLEEIAKHDYVLTPGRYVGAAEEEDDGEPFAEKMARLTAQLKDQFAQSDNLEAEIKKNLAGLGYEV